MKTRRFYEKPVIDLLEEAVHLLRLSPPGVLLRYAVGSVPFLLGLIFFWADMSRGAYAGDRLMVASAGMAALFLWMKYWHAAFAESLRRRLSADSGAPSVRPLERLAAVAMIQWSALLVMPLSLLLLFPLPWALAFYQSALLPPASPGEPSDASGVRATFRAAKALASFRVRRNCALTAVLLLFALFVFLNLFIALIQLPYLLKVFFGIETRFTMSGDRVINTTFLAATVGFTWLCVDPLIKAAYVLRALYGRSLRTGEDIRAELAAVRRSGNGAKASTVVPVVVLILIMSSFFPGKGIGAEDALPGNGSSAQTGVDAERLDRAIDQVMSHPRFAWRMDREQRPEPAEEGLLYAFLKSIRDGIEALFRNLREWINGFFEWLDDVTPEVRMPRGEREADWQSPIRWWFLATLLAVAGAVVFLVLKRERAKRTAAAQAVGTAAPEKVDLADEGVTADEMPADRWLALAREMAEKGEFRLAMRAFYLATLAGLADAGVLTIAPHKSNREYAAEFLRRAHDKGDAIDRFRRAVVAVERAWYGDYTVSADDVERFARTQERILSGVR